ncbi:MAG TPA: hypothetical protein VNI02_01075 [Blastocatellia bacterium]|jgi:DUF4097 and DUF4098 domain-containing protein YvlB|nr:hypothetical protein [Blastocatellia bacterium]
MKKNLVVLLIIMVVSLAVASQALAANAQKHDGGDSDFSERDEIKQSYELSPGARVEVRGINGTVDIETASGSTAEVHIVRSARTREDLNYRKIIVEHTGNSLVVRAEKENERGDHSVRQRVMLRLPRQVDLNVSGVNGRTNVGEIDGPVRLSGINGAVEVEQAAGYSEISGINGRVRVNIARLSDRGVQVSGVNGGVELRFAEDLNADLDVSGINGSVNTDVPNVSVIGKFNRQNFRAKIGSGGTPITIKGVNGSVRLARTGTAG